jgi:hypothetical protein
MILMEQLTIDEARKVAIDLDDDTLPQSIRVLEPLLYEDGDDYCAVFGPKREEAIIGTGKTPREALVDWDRHLGERRKSHAGDDPLIHYIEDRLKEMPRFPDEGVPVDVTDQNDEQIKLHDILYDGSHYYHLYRNAQGRLDAISCTKGYVHDIQPEELKQFRRIGSFTDFHQMLICD